MFYRVGALKNFSKFTGKFTGPRAATLLKRDCSTGLFYKTPSGECLQYVLGFIVLYTSELKDRTGNY